MNIKAICHIKIYPNSSLKCITKLRITIKLDEVGRDHTTYIANLNILSDSTSPP